MRLWHFTAGCHLSSIMREGLTLGGVVLGEWFKSKAPLDVVARDQDRFIRRGWQWLTESDSWNQGWSPRPVRSVDGHECNRTEWRLSVRIPTSGMSRLHSWESVATRFGFDDEMLTRFNEAGGVDECWSGWWLFEGPLPASWIKAWTWTRRPVLVFPERAA